MLEGPKLMCEHCCLTEKVLTSLVGSKVSRVIMKRVEYELHGQPETSIPGDFGPRIGVEQAPIPKRHVSGATYA